MYTDLDIARAADLLPIAQIGEMIGVPADDLEPYGHDKAKLPLALLNRAQPNGKLVLVTALTPTPAGEGKTTVTIGLADGLRALGKRAVVALREPSLGPVFGMKGGATGGGYAQVAPMEAINLHFTGDLHAITAANNLLAAMLDNHIYQGNALDIDPQQILWRRCMDMNDRQLRYLVDGLGGKINGRTREDGFDITAASEVMATLCMADDLSDLKARLARIVVAYTRDQRPVTAGDLHAVGAMMALLRDAAKPNLVQTLAHTPAILHGGPFANIAHGCNSVIATRMALKLGDYAVTEAGFGADLGAEKFFDIKCRATGLRPDAVVVVATVRALKMHGGVRRDALAQENAAAVSAGMPNLLRHAGTIRDVYGLPCVVAINRFSGDTDAELRALQDACAAAGFQAVLTEAWGRGAEGATALAACVLDLCEQPNDFRFAYPLTLSIEDKLNAIVRTVYHGAGVQLAPAAKKQAEKLTAHGFGELPVCIAKTQYSFSDVATLRGAPEGFTVVVRNLRVSAGAGFLVAQAGDIMTMPGLPAVPAAEQIDVDADGHIAGLF